MNLLRKRRVSKNLPLPDANLIMIERQKVEEKTKTGVIIPADSLNRPHIGTVSAIGSKVRGIKVGETIAYNNYGGFILKVGEAEYFLLKREHVLAHV